MLTKFLAVLAAFLLIVSLAVGIASAWTGSLGGNHLFAGSAVLPGIHQSAMWQGDGQSTSEPGTMTTISTQLGGDEYCGSTIYPNELYDYVSLNNASEADTLDYAYKHECSVYRCFYAYNYHYFSLSGYGVANPNTDDYICE